MCAWCGVCGYVGCEEVSMYGVCTFVHVYVHLIGYRRRGTCTCSWPSGGITNSMLFISVNRQSAPVKTIGSGRSPAIEKYIVTVVCPCG